MVLRGNKKPQYGTRGFDTLARQLVYLIPHSTKWSASRRGVGPWRWKSLQVNKKKQKTLSPHYDIISVCVLLYTYIYHSTLIGLLENVCCLHVSAIDDMVTNLKVDPLAKVVSASTTSMVRSYSLLC